tara:strand:+ start:90 stop:263 length:174 start_codon:yes stop_codon:yes gene_type:complete
MATIDLRKTQKGVTGQKITPLYPKHPVNDNKNMEKRVEGLEIKLNKILSLLENKSND